MNKVFEKDGKQRVVQDKAEEVAAVFEGYREVKKAAPAPADKAKS